MLASRKPRALRLQQKESCLYPISAFSNAVLLAHHQVGEVPVLGILHNFLQRVALPLVVRGARQHLRGAYGRG